tara:strand:- start:15637 stop:16206 length:570 start_codon:yes stop_codon:yes gene_type:complete
MKIAIHQPNFLPWYPFFQKIKEVDKFIILGHCQFEKNGFQNRFNLEGKWHTMSTKKGLDPINTKTYLNYIKDWNKIKINLPQYATILNQLDDCINENLFITNSQIIEKLTKLLGYNTEILYDYPTNLKSTERLVDICLKHNATEYFSGISGKQYLDLTKFKSKGIKVNFQENSTNIHTLELLKNEQKNI